VEQAQRAISSTAEGFTTAQALVELAHLVGIEAPIMEAVCDVVTSKITPQQAFISLMRIQTGAEIDHV
jgi:glycerol-3-phosphate dehydrogenase